MKMKEETYRICLDPALTLLEELLHEVPYYFPNLKSPIQTIILDLRFFKMFFWGLAYWEELEYDWYLRFAINSMVPKLGQAVEEFRADYEHIRRQDLRTIWKEMSYDLDKRIQQFKPQVREICMHLLGEAFKCKSCQPNQDLFSEYRRETTSFIDFILQNFKALLYSDIHLIAPVKYQIAFVQGKLKEFLRFATPVNHSITRIKKLRELISRAQLSVNHISCLACLYWVNGMDKSLVSSIGTMPFDLMHKAMPYTAGVIALYLEDAMIPQLLASYFDFVLKDLVITMKDDDVEILCQGLLFLSSFVMDPPEEDSDDRERILGQIYAIINELPSLVRAIRFDEMKEGISKALFLGFRHKVERVKSEVRDLYVKTSHSSQFNSPKTNAVGFLDSLLENLNKMLEQNVNSIPFMKYQVEIIQKELALLKPFLSSNIGLQNEHGKFRDLWTRTVGVVYYAAYVTNFYSVKSFSIWYGMICLPNVIEDIKLIKIEIQKIKDHQIYKNVYDEMKSSIALPPQATALKIEGAFIGFKKDVRSIIDYLTRGQKDLTIISISGMPGQGKTTLAKKIYNDREIQYHFHKTIWCYVSKGCKARELLMKITRDLINEDINLEFEDLADRIRKSLKKKRYLVVMDDIWDVDVWNQVQVSFPDDNNGSRILFTSRNHNVAFEAKLKSISHQLPLFSEEESWELMKEKLYSSYDGASQEFLEIAKQVVIHCKGLPLAVVLAATILRRTKPKLDLWIEVAENLKLHLAREGCGSIIELSYKYLPDYLKPCFLYFGVFQRGEDISAKNLKLLWIAEGFIRDNEMKSSEDLANEYLNDLVSQSLVVVTERSPMGGIKRCNVHDLLYDLCLEKAMEENFLHWAKKNIVIDPCNSGLQKYGHHRLCIGTVDPFIKARPLCTRKELPTSQVHSLLWIYHHSDSSWNPTHESISWFVKSFKVLTVLDLEGMYMKYDKFFEAIVSIIHLRYLALKIRSRIGGIPLSIANLWNLETLIVRGQRLDDPLPVSMWQMKSLKHVDLPRARLHCEDFEENNSFAAYNIGTLGTIIVSYDSKTKEFLRKLQRLRKLVCYLQKKDYHYMWFSLFGSLEKLESLKIYGVSGERLFYNNYPKFDFLENLKELTLRNVYLLGSGLSAIGKQLLNLQVLKLYTDAFVGSKWNLEDGDFSKLTYLKLRFLDIKEIDVSGCEDNPPFPCLEQLVVEYCHYLKEIPSIFGEIYTLKTIRITNCSRKATKSVRKILENQREMGNDDLQVFDDYGGDDDDDDEVEEYEEDDDDDDGEEIAEKDMGEERP